MVVSVMVWSFRPESLLQQTQLQGAGGVYGYEASGLGLADFLAVVFDLTSFFEVALVVFFVAVDFVFGAAFLAAALVFAAVLLLGAALAVEVAFLVLGA